MFLDLDDVRIIACLWECQRALRIHKKYPNLSSEDERRSYGFVTTRG